MKKHISITTWLILCCILIAGLFVFSLFLGRYPLTLSLLYRRDTQALRVFFSLRLPRAFMAMFGGFALGIAGNVYQTVFRNPLAAPDMIGVSSGASVGAAFAILFLSATPMTITLSSFAGGLVCVGIALALSCLAPGHNPASIVLSGIAVHSLAQTLLMLLKLTADPEKELASIEYWIMGSLNGISLYRLPTVVFICTVGIFFIFLLSRQILLLSVEDTEAKLLGVPVSKMRLVVLLLATLIVAAIISMTGLISFIGLLAPHIARLLSGKNQTSTLCLSGLTGSVLLLISDMLAKSLTASELPVSIFTSLLGAPFLIFLLIRRNTNQ